MVEEEQKMEEALKEIQKAIDKIIEIIPKKNWNKDESIKANNDSRIVKDLNKKKLEDLLKSKNTAEVMALMAKKGYKKLSLIPESDYVKIMEEVKNLPD